MALFIGRLPSNTDRRDLEDIFGKYGRISRCDIKRGTGAFNFGFIEYEDRRDAEDAKQASEQRDFTYRGERIVVEWAKGANRDTRSEDCFKCGRSGHWARECPDARRSRSPRRRGGRSRSRSPVRRRRSRSRSRSPPPRRDRDFDRGRDRSPRRDSRDEDDNRRRADRSRSPAPASANDRFGSRSPSPKD